MKLFIRSSICMIRCTKRMLATATTEATSLHPANNEKRLKRLDHRYVATIDTDLNISKKLKSQSPIEDKHWIEMRDELIRVFTDVTDKNVDSHMIDLLYTFKRADVVATYIEFLKKNNHNIGLGVLGKYFRYFYGRQGPPTEAEKEEICKLYDELRKEHRLLDSTLCTDCTLGLSLTHRWKECIELKEMCKLSCNPSVTIYNAIIRAAFKNNEPAIAWEHLEESVLKNPIHPYSFLEHANYCKRNLRGAELMKELERVLFFWRENNIKPATSVIDTYCDLFNDFGYKANYTTVRKNGMCLSCRSILPENTLTPDEFKSLSKAILKNVIIGENLFCATSPQELKKYMLFIKTLPPYDVVIDGLNVAYATKKKNQPNQRGSLKNILNVVNYFTKDKKRVLVIGRAHMAWWNKELMKELQTKCHVYLVKNISQDDPFLLHVTLVSGSQTHFVSRDLMRQHKSQLDFGLRDLFKRWQLSRQFFFRTELNKNRITIIPPIRFDMTVQKSKQGWHIPYDSSEQLMLPDSYDQPEQWVCLRKNDNNSLESCSGNDVK